MKTALLIILIGLSLVRYACASGAPSITVTAADSGINYRLVDNNRRTEKDVKTLDEVGAWIAETLKDEKDKGVLVYSDNHTTFGMILELLLCLKTSGVTSFTAGRIMSRGAEQTFHYLHGKTDKVEINRWYATPSGK